jgi:hypothetical protein
MTKYLLAAFLTVALFSSCVEPFEINTNNASPVIVIYGCLTGELDYHKIKVSASSPYFATTLNRNISDADVKITSSDGKVFAFKEIDSVPGLYRTVDRVAGIPGNTYSLSVATDFDNDGVKETYFATSTMPDVVEVDSIEVKNVTLMGYKFHFLNLYMQDPLSEDYYLGQYKINDSAIFSSIDQFSPMSDVGFNGQYINGQTVERFLDLSEKNRIEEFDGNDDDDERRKPVYVTAGDVMTFSLCRIEKGYYSFISQCKKEMRGENPFFGGPPSNIVTNISNGGLGFFTTYSISTAKITVK